MGETILVEHRLSQGLTSEKKLILAAALGDRASRIYLLHATNVEIPDADLSLRDLIPLVHACCKKTWVRFALVCAEAQLPICPARLRRLCRQMITESLAWLASPHREYEKRLHATRERSISQHSAWLRSKDALGEARRIAGAAYMGLSLCITCVQENLPADERMRFLNGTPDLLLQYIEFTQAHAAFFRRATKDLIPWLKGEYSF